MVRIPLSQSTLMDNEKKKVVISGSGASASHGGDTRGHCWEEQRLCLYPCGPSCPLSSLLSAFSINTVWFETRALWLPVRGADAIIKVTHGHEEAHCPRHTIFLMASE